MSYWKGWNFSRFTGRLSQQQEPPPVEASIQPVVLVGDTRELVPPYLGPQAHLGGAYDQAIVSPARGVMDIHVKSPGGAWLDGINLWIGLAAPPTTYPAAPFWWDISASALSMSGFTDLPPVVSQGPFVSTARLGEAAMGATATQFPWLPAGPTWTLDDGAGAILQSISSTQLYSGIFVPSGMHWRAWSIYDFTGGAVYATVRVREYPEERGV